MIWLPLKSKSELPLTRCESRSMSKKPIHICWRMCTTLSYVSIAKQIHTLQFLGNCPQDSFHINQKVVFIVLCTSWAPSWLGCCSLQSKTTTWIKGIYIVASHKPNISSNLYSDLKQFIIKYEHFVQDNCTLQKQNHTT